MFLKIGVLLIQFTLQINFSFDNEHMKAPLDRAVTLLGLSIGPSWEFNSQQGHNSPNRAHNGSTFSIRTAVFIDNQKFM